MGYEFETANESEVVATPEQVWEAIATGPGINSWFMGRSEVVPGEGGVIRTAFGGYEPESPVTGWDPGQRLAYGGDKAEDGRFVAYEFLIEGRDHGSTVLKLVTSGFLPGDDWADEYEAMTKGMQLFFRTLVEYVTHFAGGEATPLTVFGPAVDDWPAAWVTLGRAFGLAGAFVEGDRVRSKLVDGVVYFVNDDTVGIRADDGLYRLMRGFRGPLIASHHVFGYVDEAQTQKSWQTWMAEVFS
jgi:uncharacterized protein YndB with AHSA1/START domain